MELNQFKLIKFLGTGNFSLVYEVTSNRDCDRNQTYAMKRFFLQDSFAINGAIREQHVLRRLASNVSKSPFLETLYYSFLHNDLPVLILSKGSGFDLFDIIEYFCPLSEEQAIFYCSEVISGLIDIHAMGIVHLDIKPENILLSNTGHAMISDFDCAYELAHSAGPPKSKDFRGTTYFLAPEIACQFCIRYEADSWGVGALMACLLADKYRPEATSDAALKEQARQGKWEVHGFENFTPPLQAFLKSCFALNPARRPLPLKMKSHEIFSNVNWDPAELLRRKAPFQPSDIHQQMGKAKYSFDPSCRAILQTAHWKLMPKFPSGFPYSESPLDANELGSIAPNKDELRTSGMTPQRIHKLFEDFDFVNECALDDDDDEII